MQNDTLKIEEETFQQHKQQLLATDEGRWVLIKGREIAGVFDTEREAFEAGYKLFELAGFMIQQILVRDIPVSQVSVWQAQGSGGQP
jgi:hypothetical protein